MSVRQSKVVTNGERTTCGPSPEAPESRRTRTGVARKPRARCRKDRGTAYDGGPGGIRPGRGLRRRGGGSREEREADGATVRARGPGPRLRAALVAAAACQGTGELAPARAFRHP